MFNYKELYRLADAWALDFKEASPFPYVCLNHFLTFADYEALFKAFPSPGDPTWKTPTNVHTKNKMVTRRGENGLKEFLFSPALRDILHEFNSGSFLHFLERLTGITGLLPDPYFVEGGPHCIGNGGFLDIHADFSHHDSLGLERRLNLLLYLNGNWQPEYGGELFLCDTDLAPVIKLAPSANRCVILETSETSFHGHPVPMELPPGIFRRSLALYYYSLPRPERDKKKIIFPTDPGFVHVVTP